MKSNGDVERSKETSGVAKDLKESKGTLFSSTELGPHVTELFVSDVRVK